MGTRKNWSKVSAKVSAKSKNGAKSAYFWPKTFCKKFLRKFFFEKIWNAAPVWKNLIEYRDTAQKWWKIAETFGDPKFLQKLSATKVSAKISKSDRVPRSCPKWGKIAEIKSFCKFFFFKKFLQKFFCQKVSAKSFCKKFLRKIFCEKNTNAAPMWKIGSSTEKLSKYGGKLQKLLDPKTFCKNFLKKDSAKSLCKKILQKKIFCEKFVQKKDSAKKIEHKGLCKKHPKISQIRGILRSSDQVDPVVLDKNFVLLIMLSYRGLTERCKPSDPRPPPLALRQYATKKHLILIADNCRRTRD